MPKCADVQLQLGSDNLLHDIKDVRILSETPASRIVHIRQSPQQRHEAGRVTRDLTLGSVHLPSWPD